jgi:hypothetical protein
MSKLSKRQCILIALYFALVLYLSYLLFDARTPAARTIWETFDPSNMAVVFVMSVVLLAIVLSKGSSMMKMALILLHSVLSRLFSVIVFETRFGWDTWASLGWCRYIYGGDFDPRLAPFTLFSQRESIVSLVYHAVDRVNLYSLSVISARIFSVDVSWTHLLLNPLLWGIFTPVLIYKISNLITKEKKVSLLSTLLSCSIPSLISWGALTTSNGLAWVLCLLTIYLCLKYLSSSKGLLLAFVITFITFTTHPVVGMLSLATILLVYMYARARVSMFIPIVFLLPVMLLGTTLAIGGNTTFALDNLKELTGYDTVFLFIFGGYYRMPFREVLAHVVVFFLGLIGFVYVCLGNEDGKYNRKLAVFMFLCTALAMIDYRIIKMFMVNVPFSVERIWVFRDLLAIPFAAIVISKTMSFLSEKLVPREDMVTKIKSFKSRFFRNPFSFRKILIDFLFALCISSLLTLAIYNGYAHYGEAIWTTQSELEAAQYIESTTQNETYVVICQALARLAGWAVVGHQNPRAYYFGAYEVEKLKALYREMVSDPSMGPIMDAKDVNNASLVFVIFTTFRPPKSDLAVELMMNLPHSELYGVFGDDVYVFKVQPPATRTISGIGPPVYLYNNQTYVNTTFSGNVVTYEANYTLALAGSSNYSITEWPMSWSFENVEPIPTAQYIDGNNWVNFTGHQDTTYTIMWKANLLYQSVGWKDDSFEEDWRVESSYHWLPEHPPQISTDGDVIDMTGVFREGVREGIWLVKDVSNVSTDDFPYVLVRWRSTSTCAIVSVSYDGENMYVLKPEATYPYAQYSADWKVSLVKLPPGKNVTAVRLALDDYPQWTDIGGTHSAYFDFIMLCDATKPQF